MNFFAEEIWGESYIQKLGEGIYLSTNRREADTVQKSM